MRFFERNNDNPTVSKFRERLLRLEALERRELLSVTTGNECVALENNGEEIRYENHSATPEVVVLNEDSFGADVSLTSIDEQLAAQEIFAQYSQEFCAILDEEIPDDLVSSCEVHDESSEPAIGLLDNLDVSELDADELVAGLMNSGGSGGSGSGGSGGTGGSGGSVMNVSLSGGSNYVEGETVYLYFEHAQQGDVVNISITVLGSNSGLIAQDDLTQSVNVSSSGSGSFTIHTIFAFPVDGTQTFRIDVSVESTNNTTIGSNDNSFIVTVFDRPEFDSDVDTGTDIYSDTDTYRAYIKSDYLADATITTRNPIHAAGASLYYEFVGTNNLFQIDHQTGAITLTQNVQSYLESGAAQTSWSLRIRARVNMPGFGNGTLYSDEADVNIVLSDWNVARNSSSYTASATAVDGCKISELALAVGLDPSEFRDWLTIYNEENASLDLFDGTTVSASELSVDDVLAANVQFRIPNTIYMAWFGEYGSNGQYFMNWSINVTDLQNLGFKVVQFNNDNYQNSGSSQARNDFFSTLEELSSNKKLQGMYIVGEGTQLSIGANTNNGHVSGPLWRIDYDGPDTMGNHSRVSLISALTYHMGSLVIHASQSDNSHSKSLVTSESQGGIFCGYTGEYNRLTSDHDPICKNWGCKFDEISWVLNGGFHVGCEYPYFIGGKQRTSTITRTYDNPLQGVSLDPDSGSDD